MPRGKRKVEEEEKKEEKPQQDEKKSAESTANDNNNNNKPKNNDNNNNNNNNNKNNEGDQLVGDTVTELITIPPRFYEKADPDQVPSFAKRFAAIAELLLNKTTLYVNNKPHQFVEIVSTTTTSFSSLYYKRIGSSKKYSNIIELRLLD